MRYIIGVNRLKGRLEKQRERMGHNPPDLGGDAIAFAWKKGVVVMSLTRGRSMKYPVR